MAGHRPDRFHAFFEVLMNICPKVERHVLQTYVTLSKPDDTDEWSLDHFLYDNKTKIARSNAGQNSDRILFPGWGKRTKVEDWKLHVLYFVLKDICSGLPADVLHAIKSIRIMRNEFKDRPNTDMANDEFSSLIEKTKQLLETCFEYTGDIEMKRSTLEELQTIIDSGKTDSYIQTEESVINTMHEWHLNDKHSQDRLEDSTQTELKQVRDKLDTVISLHHERQKQVGQVSAVPPRLQPPVTRIPMLLKNCPAYMERRLSKMLVQMFEENMNKAKREQPEMAGLTQPQREAIRREVQKTASHLETKFNLKLVETKEGCVELHVQCASLTDLINMFASCVVGEVTEMFLPLQHEIRKIPDCENFTQEVVVLKEDYDNSIKILVAELNGLVDDIAKDIPISFEQLSASRQITSVTAKDDKIVVINIQSETENERNNLQKAVEDGSVAKLFEPLADKISRSLQSNDTKDLLIEILADTDWKKRQRSKRRQGKQEHGQPLSTPFEEEVITRSDSARKGTHVKLIADIDVRCEDDHAHRIANTGLALVTKSLLVAVDIYNCCAKLVDVEERYNVVSRLEFEQERINHDNQPWNVTTVTVDETHPKVAVTLPISGKVAFLNVSATELSIERKIKVGDNCRGIVHNKAKNTLIISYGSPESTIKSVNMDGTVLETFVNKTADGSKLFIEPWCIAFNEDTKTIYVAETTKSSITRLKLSGEFMDTIRCGDKVTSPRGIAIAPNGSLFIVGYIRDVICQMSASGDIRVVLDKNDGIEASHDAVFCHETNKLYVTCRIEPKKPGDLQTARIKVFDVVNEH